MCNIFTLVTALAIAAGVAGCRADVLPRLEGTIIFPGDDSFGKPDQSYRMAVMVRTEDGRKIPDFFKGISAPGGKIVGTGNAVLTIPYIGPTSEMFARDFPDADEKGFSLTFREFKGNRYSLKDVPYGTAYVWLQTSADGSRVTHYPLVVPITRDLARMGVLDIDIKKPMDLYISF